LLSLFSFSLLHPLDLVICLLGGAFSAVVWAVEVIQFQVIPDQEHRSRKNYALPAFNLYLFLVGPAIAAIAFFRRLSTSWHLFLLSRNYSGCGRGD
jgi:hypothetical protein